MGILFCLENTAYAARLGKGGQEPFTWQGMKDWESIGQLRKFPRQIPITASFCRKR